MKTIYLDNAASTPIRDEVFCAMLPFLQETYGNPSSIHHKGRAAYDALSTAREEVARDIGAHGKEIIFTSGGTESNNLALHGVMKNVRHRKSHILVSAIEHVSVLASAEDLRGEGCDEEYIPVDTYGLVSVKEVMTRVRADTALISIMYANNEIGTVEPIAEIAKALRDRFGADRPLLHTDACQAPGQLPLDVTTLGVDLMTLNGSKMYGPKGVGMLYVREGVRFTPTARGGHQEHGMRAGTENLAGIVGFARALTLAEEDQTHECARLINLRDTLITRIQKSFPDATLHGHPTLRLPGNVHFSFPHIEGESLVLLLDTFGICASTGSACNAEDLVPSHVLRAIGISVERIHGTLRFTLGRTTTEADIDTTVDALTHAVTRLTRISPSPLHL
ncbi:cysteine desulfurase [Candidatus Kaiserbacteria bacterium]|nr:MAG: cysteine desulfurase [Candidatus Kaiserbacteria bacterium]